MTGIADAWVAPGWLAARPTDETDPWAVLGASVIPEPGTVSGMGAGFGPGVSGGLPAGIGLTGNGGLDVAGLEWLGARAYDPTARGFLSTDPLAPVLGAGWDGNPYAYAGNNPLNASDPTGLRPLTDEQLKAQDGARRGMLAAAGDWWDDNWEYVVAGAAVVAGVALMATGIGGPIGVALIGAASGALISGGVSIASQKAANGNVDWGQVGVDTLIGGAAGLAGGGVGGVMAKFAPTMTQAGTGVTRSAIRFAFSSTGRAGLGLFNGADGPTVGLRRAR